MAICTQADADKKLLMKIIGGDDEVFKVTPDMARCRHHSRMVMLVRWTFLRYCQRHRVNELSLDGFGHDLKKADIRMWMDGPYMKLHKVDGGDAILFQYSTETMKELYHYIKGLN